MTLRWLRSVYTAAQSAAWQIESRGFDYVRCVQTSGDVSLQQAGISPAQAKDSGRYSPSRPANVREAIRSIAVSDLQPYTFVDLGSGKGRCLFVAAEFRFHSIVGVEFSPALHELALHNRSAFRYRGCDAGRIHCLLQDAARFTFPGGPLVIFMFNPFGAATMQAVAQNLGRSLQAAPRHVAIVLLRSMHGHVLLRIPGMTRVSASRRYELFEAHAPAAQVRPIGHSLCAGSPLRPRKPGR